VGRCAIEPHSASVDDNEEIREEEKALFDERSCLKDK
jgi:hypothetical protein